MTIEYRALEQFVPDFKTANGTKCYLLPVVGDGTLNDPIGSAIHAYNAATGLEAFYRELCAQGQCRPGWYPPLWSATTPCISLFPTTGYPFDTPADFDTLEATLKYFVHRDLFRNWHITDRLAIPQFGYDAATPWSKVHDLLITTLTPLKSFQILIYGERPVVPLPVTHIPTRRRRH